MKYINSCINIVAIVKRNTFSIINSNRFLLITGSAHNNNKGCYNGFCRFSFLVLGRWIFFHQDPIISLDQVFFFLYPRIQSTPFILMSCVHWTIRLICLLYISFRYYDGHRHLQSVWQIVKKQHLLVNEKNVIWMWW